MNKNFITSWQSILSNSTAILYQPDQVIFYEGHSPYGVYILISGDVDLIKNEKGEKIRICALPPNCTIGLDILLTDKAYPFSAVAKSPSEIIFIPKDLIIRFD